MSQTLFDDPHRCTDAEYAALVGTGSAADVAAMRAIDLDPAASHDARWTRIHDLYAWRGDAAGMAHAQAQIQDREWAAELAYRDIVPTPSDLPG